MTALVFFWSTPRLLSQSSQDASIAEPLIPTVKSYWAMVQGSPFWFDAHQTNSRWLAYLAFFSRSLFCAQSSVQSDPVYQSRCSETPSLESIGLVISRKAQTFAFLLKATPFSRTLRHVCGFNRCSRLRPNISSRNGIPLSLCQRPSGLFSCWSSDRYVPRFLSFPTLRA